MLRALQDMDVVNASVSEKDIIKQLSASELVKTASPAEKKAILAFASFQLKEVVLVGASALLLELPYCELEFLRSLSPFIQQSLEVRGESIVILKNYFQSCAYYLIAKATNATPLRCANPLSRDAHQCSTFNS